MAPRLNFLPDALSKTLLDFQVEGVLFGISKNGRCLIGDEMGLGKTLQALSVAYYYKNEWPLLIVCPSSMRFPWIEEIEKWLPDIQPDDINLVQSCIDASNIQRSKISIVGYGLLSHAASRTLIKCLKETKFGVAIIDESHYMKNRKAVRTQALVSVVKQTKRAILLTGTPALARPEELYVQIDVLKPNLLGSFSKFANRYCDAHTEHFGAWRSQRWNTRGASNLEELHQLLKRNVMIRRLKCDVLTELPAKQRQKITFDLAESNSKKEMEKVVDEFRSVCKQLKGIDSSQNRSQINPLSEINRLTTMLYKQTGISKISVVRQYVAEILDNTEKKFLVFAHHVDVMKAIEVEVVKKRVKYIRIAGDVPSSFRSSLVHQFQTDPSTRVAILSILAASTGITLTAADHLIFAELHWTPGVMEQAEDRVHRIGQKNSVLIQYLIAKGTIDEVLWRMICNKVYVTTTALNGKLQGMNVEEGSENQSKLFEAFSAFVMEDEDDAVPDDNFLFTHSQKKRKQDSLQRSLMEFFNTPTSKCRKTDDGKESSEPSTSQKEQKSDEDESPHETVVEAKPETDTVLIVDSDDENSLKSTTKKTYKLEKKKTRKTKQKLATVDASESQEMAWEVARELTKVDVNESFEPVRPQVIDMLSTYTRVLNKTKLELEKNDCEDKSDGLSSESDEENSFELAKSNKKVIVEVNEENIDKDLSVRRSLEEQAGDNDLSLVQQIHSAPSTPICAQDTPQSSPIAANDEPAEYQKKQTNPEPLAPTSAEDINDFKTWSCSICTFNNNDFLRVCEMCDAPRYRSRRKTSNIKCSTDGFVARKQKSIFEKFSPVGDQKSGSRKPGMRKDRKCAVGSVKDNKGCDDVTIEGTNYPQCSSIFHSKKETLAGLNSPESKDELPAKPDLLVKPELSIPPEVPVKPDLLVEDEIPNKRQLGGQIKLEMQLVEPEIQLVEPDKPVKPGKRCDVFSSDVDLFATESPTEESSDEIMTSSSPDKVMSSFEDKIMTSPGETDTATEFEDIADDDWWECTSCKNYNFGDGTGKCEACGLRKESENLEYSMTGLDEGCWQCQDCKEFYFRDDVKCTKCCHGNKTDRKPLVEQYKELRHLLIEDERDSDTPDEETGGHIGKLEVIENLMFRLSNYTDRVYLYDESGKPLNCSVNITDMESLEPKHTSTILSEPSNRRQITRFVRKWKSLSQNERRKIRKAGIIFEDPHEALQAIKWGREERVCTSRFPSKEKLQAEVMEAAVEKNGSVRHCVKRKGSIQGGKTINERTEGGTVLDKDSAAVSKETRWMQAVDENGQPLCLFCKDVVNTKCSSSLWDERFCSQKCKDQYQCRVSGSRVREKLFQDEKGVCQQCGCNAHELYRTMSLLPKAERRTCLEKTSFLTLPVAMLNKMIVDPKEGMFWEADHVIAVVEGGGECDLENYRTLCVPCHRRVTAELRERLRTNRKRIAGIPDIASFFRS